MKRRDFIKRSVQAGTLLPLASSGLMARPLAYTWFPRPAGTEDRILVLINLNGGNDGLNTVIPFEDQTYYDARPDLQLSRNSTHEITDSLGLHSALGDVYDLYSDGDCAVVNNVGYTNQNRSHFRSTDIWHTASESEEILFTGWLGRYLQNVHPEYPATLPESPFALQISTSTSLALLGENGNMGIALENPERFYRLANGLEVEPAPLPDTKAGPELEYVRNIIQQSDSFSGRVNDAIIAGKNHVSYQTNSLASQLQVVARLIDGGLPTSVYIVSLGGFDTHSNQGTAHNLLLSYLSTSIRSFLDDIKAGGNSKRVVCMTYSEFGRRLNQNGSNGTDHGAAAPQFIFGEPVQGGQLLGGNPDLQNLDERGDIRHTIDFRRIYSSILSDWLGISAGDTASILGGSFETLPLFSTSSISEEDRARFAGIHLSGTSPNPARDYTAVSITLPRAMKVAISIGSTEGKDLGALVEKTLAAGTHRLHLNLAHIRPGAYIYTLRTEDYRISRRLMILR